MVHVSARRYALGGPQPDPLSCCRDSAWPVSFTGSNIHGLVTPDHLCAARDWADSFPDRKRVSLQQAVLVSCHEYRAARWHHSLEFWVRYLGKKVCTLGTATSSAPSLNSPFHRRWSFNLTLFIGGVFGIAMGGSLTFVALASLAAISSVGVGGNIPVDSAVFLGLSILYYSFCYVWHIDACPDFIPSSHQYLLTFMAIWWTFGQLFGSLVCPAC